MTNAIVRFLKDEEGATAIEYGILAGLMATLLVSIFAPTSTGFGGKLTAAFWPWLTWSSRPQLHREKNAMLKVFLAGWLIVVSAYDLGQLRIPNWLVAMGAAAAAFALSTEPLSFQPRGWYIAAGIAAAVAALLPAYIFNIMGAADVKLGVVLALWFSLAGLGTLWVVGSLLCGLHAAFLLVTPMLRQRMFEAGHGSMPPAGSTRKRKIPYGAYLAVGALATMAGAA